MRIASGPRRHCDGAAMVAVRPVVAARAGWGVLHQHASAQRNTRIRLTIPIHPYTAASIPSWNASRPQARMRPRVRVEVRRHCTETRPSQHISFYPICDQIWSRSSTLCASETRASHTCCSVRVCSGAEPDAVRHVSTPQRRRARVVDQRAAREP